jgi:hypothetical protein
VLILSLTASDITGIVIYVSCVVIVISLPIFAHKKYRDPGFLQGLVLSALFHILILLPNLFLIWLGLIYVIGFSFGILSGIYNTNVKRGALCGSLGVLISWTAYGILNFEIITYLFSARFFLIWILPAIILGAPGGILGRKIREIKFEKEAPKRENSSNE